MLFNSLDFAVFLPVVFVLYWFVFNKNLRLQNALIVVASYFFYGWWDWKFLFLILLSTTVDFFIALAISAQKNSRSRKSLLILSLTLNLGFLGFFKYFNFFAGNLQSAFSFFGNEISFHPMSIVLPVGISFYTFQLLSYTIDVYRGKLQATKDFISFSAFVCFFPQLVAGPIERATHLLPQFYVKREFDYSKAVNGLRQILWGLFKKIVIADNCATYVDWVFTPSTNPGGSTVALGAILFAFQIYGDFSGYSDIAIGTARLFGIDIMRNFAYPYFARSVPEFWRRWHISLTTWFRDYVYIPLGGSRGSTGATVRNILIVFMLSGLWHGANWTFIIWGLIHALFYMMSFLLTNGKVTGDFHEAGTTGGKGDLIRMPLTFTLISFAWIFFRAPSIADAIAYSGVVFSSSLFALPAAIPSLTLWFIGGFTFVEWVGRNDQYAIANLGSYWPKPARVAFYYALLVLIFVFGGEPQQFIYFQF